MEPRLWGVQYVYIYIYMFIIHISLTGSACGGGACGGEGGAYKEIKKNEMWKVKVTILL